MKSAIFLIVVLILGLSACGPAYHLKRAEKHLRKAEQLGASVRVDTVYKEIKVIVPEVKTDTLIKTLNSRDTLFLERDKIKIKLRIDTLKKSVYIAVKCPSDTVKISVPVTITKEIESGFPWGWVVLVWCIGAAMGLFASKR